VPSLNQRKPCEEKRVFQTVTLVEGRNRAPYLLSFMKGGRIPKIHNVGITNRAAQLGEEEGKEDCFYLIFSPGDKEGKGGEEYLPGKRNWLAVGPEKGEKKETHFLIETTWGGGGEGGVTSLRGHADSPSHGALRVRLEKKSVLVVIPEVQRRKKERRIKASVNEKTREPLGEKERVFYFC